MKQRSADGRILILLLPLMSLAAIGCASSNAKPVDARAAGEWTFRLPETRSPYASLAVAHGTEAELAKVTAGDVKPGDQAFLAAERKAKPQPAARMRTAAPAVREPNNQEPAAPTAAPQATEQAPELLAVNTPAPATTTGSDAERYSDREANAQKQREYRGGDAIVISASALVVILLIVVLILLLT